MIRRMFAWFLDLMMLPDDESEEYAGPSAIDDFENESEGHPT